MRFFYELKKLRTAFWVLTAILLLAGSGCSALPKFPAYSFQKQSEAPYRCVFDIHTQYSHDSSGSIPSVILAAKKRNLNFVIITDHNSMKAREDPALSQDPLLIIGNEISTTDGHLISLGTRKIIEPPIEPQKAIDQIHSDGGFAVIAHPVCAKSAWQDWNVKNVDGIEVYNHACDFYDSNKLTFLLKSLTLSPTFFRQQAIREPRKMLAKWDSILSSNFIAGFGAIDAHERYSVFGFPLMHYTNLFGAVTMYVKADSMSEKDILNALVKGKSYLVFESLGSAPGFQFQAKSNQEIFESGSFVKSESPAVLYVSAESPSEINLIKNGNVILKSTQSSINFAAKEPGVYRVEVIRYGKIWIISNPITIQN